MRIEADARALLGALLVACASTSAACGGPKEPVAPSATPSATPTAPTPPTPAPTAIPPASAASTDASAPRPPSGPRVACALPAPPMARAKEGSFTLQRVLEVPGRLDVFGLDGRVLFGRMGKPTSGSHGPGGGYLNRFYELVGTAIKPVKALQKGLWDDFSIAAIDGHWPEATTLRGTNFGNTAWEEVFFVWDPAANAWDTKQDGAIAWQGGRLRAKRSFAKQSEPEIFQAFPSSSALGVPEDLFAGIPEGSASLVVAPSRDLYARKNPCDAEGKHCDTQAIYHWCAPRKGFETVALPDLLEGGAIVAVPGAALAYDADDGYLVRDGIVTKIALPAKNLPAHWLRASGGAIFYLGEQGLSRLEEDGFRRLFAWSRAREGEKLSFEGQTAPVQLTGFVARSATDVMLTTWDGKRSQVWSTATAPLSL